MRKEIVIGEKTVAMESNAFLPIFYKKKFGADIFKEMNVYAKAAQNNEVEAEFILRLSWSMAAQAGEQLEFEEWLKTVELYDLIGSIGEIIELFSKTTKTSSTPKKK